MLLLRSKVVVRLGQITKRHNRKVNEKQQNKDSIIRHDVRECAERLRADIAADIARFLRQRTRYFRVVMIAQIDRVDDDDDDDVDDDVETVALSNNNIIS